MSNEKLSPVGGNMLNPSSSRLSPIIFKEALQPSLVSITPEDEDDNREDGEISEDDMDDIDYEILPRPKELLEEVKANETVNNGIKVLDTEVTGLGSAGGTGNELGAAVGPLSYSYSDNEDEREGSSSDSDSDEPSFKRKICTNFGTTGLSLPFNNPNSLETTKSPWNLPSSMSGFTHQCTSTAVCDEKMLKFQEKRKMNNIWTKVIEEEEQMQTLTKLGDIDVDGKRVIVERGSESYSFQPGTSSTLKRKRNIPGSHKKNRSRHIDSDISSTGLSDDDLLYINDSKCNKMKQDDADNVPGSGNYKLLPIKRIQQIVHKKRGRDLSYYIANELGEPKTQLIVRACELLGKHYCIRMFIKTLKIERKGGLPIKSQTRRRTPGGIFFYMIRKDDKFPSETVNKVFELDREISMKEKKAARTLQRHERKAELELRQHRMMKMKGTKPMDEENKVNIKEDAMDEEGELLYSDSADSGPESDVSLDSNPEFQNPSVDDSNEGEISDELTNDYLDIQVASNEFD